MAKKIKQTKPVVKESYQETLQKTIVKKQKDVKR